MTFSPFHMTVHIHTEEERDRDRHRERLMYCKELAHAVTGAGNLEFVG